MSEGGLIGTMGNTGNVLKGDGTKPSEEELEEGRGTHLDYTVYDKDNKKLPLNIALAYSGIENTTGKEDSSTAEAVRKGYKTATQQKIYKQILKEGGTPPNIASQNLSEAQSKSVQFSRRMNNALEILKQKKEAITELSPLKLAFYRRAAGTEFGNQIVPSDVQQYLQAESDFLKASLRKESGAAIPPEEEKSFQKTFGVLPGDSPEVIEQKFDALEEQLKGMVLTA